jgi:hypothetical protein
MTLGLICHLGKDLFLQMQGRQQKHETSHSSPPEGFMMLRHRGIFAFTLAFSGGTVIP